MARAIAHGELTARVAGRVSFEIAASEHDAAIRRLLRESAMDGDVILTREREPDYFAGANIAGAEDETVVAVEGGTVVGIAGCSIRQRYVNGMLCRVGYLGELRLSRAAQGRFDILRRGYQFYASRHRHEPAGFYFTSIAADNTRSIRFLERGLPGMPRYEFLTEFVTLLIPARSPWVGRGVPTAPKAAFDEEQEVVAKSPSSIADCLNTNGAQYQFAAHWTADEVDALRRWALPLSDFQTISVGHEIIACAALWDQRAFKQTVIRAYSPRLRLTRPLVNVAARVLGDVSLPASGSSLALAYLSPLAVSRDDEPLLLRLLQRCMCAAAERGLEVVTLGFAANDPRIETVRRNFRCREYRTRLYRVRWPDMETDVGALDGRIIAPEVALL